MAITPFDGIDRPFDRMFDSWPEFTFRGTGTGELVEREHVYVYVLDLPGFDSSEIDLRYDDGRLSVVAERADEIEYTSHRRSVREAIHVPGAIDEESISASFKNGVLEVELPMMALEEDTDTRIPIED